MDQNTINQLLARGQKLKETEPRSATSTKQPKTIEVFDGTEYANELKRAWRNFVRILLKEMASQYKPPQSI